MRIVSSLSNHRRNWRIEFVSLFLMLCAASEAQTLDTIGVTLLRQTTTNLDGSGVRVAMIEGPDTGASPPTFEVNPVSPAVTQPGSKFIYHSSIGTATNFPNAVGGSSSHATDVGRFFFGTASGVATNPAAVDNYDADHFINSVVFAAMPPAIPARIVNQSFIFGPITTPEQISYDQTYDDYADAHNTLFISGVGNGDTNLYNGAVNVPASCYNGIGVAAYGTVNSSIGPTADNGRCKPDITAPNVHPWIVTSFTTPLVSGSAAVLLQAALRGDGGNDTNAASDMRILKALLLNGAIKPSGWTNGPSTPLDARYGAGVVNVFNSYMQLAGGKHTALASATVGTGDLHPPITGVNSANPLHGWDFESLSSSMNNDRINHYYFDVSNGVDAAGFTFTATLAWNRQQGEADINDLDLYLYDTANSNLVAQSISFVNNVEHLFVPHLPTGRYNLQVWKAGGNAANGRVTNDETYALAWEFFTLPLQISQADTNVVLAWPIYPTGFVLQSTPSLSAANWSANLPAPVVSNNTNHVSLAATNDARFFRLRRP
jgi:hypothetical protein